MRRLGDPKTVLRVRALSHGWWNSSCLVVGIWIMFLCPLESWGSSAEPVLDAHDLLQLGTSEVGLAVGFWQAVNFVNTPPSTDRSAVFLLPRVGWVVSNETKAGLLSGTLELVLEPMYARFTKPFAANAAGGSWVLKYNLVSFGRLAPFWDVGLGMLWTNLAPRIPEQSTPFNFIIETGPGIHYFLTTSLAVTASVHYHHISNADIGQRNTGLNATLSYVGLSWFLPR